MPFDSPDVNLGDLLKDVDTGKLQLPDFQRPWKWDTDHISSLLASISLGYPVGVMMTLQTGGEVSFQPRPISGTPDPTGPPAELVLDGQQRLTSLYQALYSGNIVDTADPRGKRLERWYYLDLAMCLDPDADREEAIIAVPADRKITTNFGRDLVADYSTTALEVGEEVFPLSRLFDAGTLFAWQNEYISVEGADAAERSARWIEFYESVLANVLGYTVPVIKLSHETKREAVCTVFEKVNTGGVVLNVFELLTAMFASDPVRKFRLGDDWAARRAKLTDKPVLQSVTNVDFLQVITLLATHARRAAYLGAGGDPGAAPAVGCKRREMLRLTLDEYESWADAAVQALLAVSQFLSGQRIFQAKDVPYRTQLVPLAAIFATLGTKAQLVGVSDKIARWFWCGIFGELYGGATETRFARDVVEVPSWIDDGTEPTTITEALFSPARLLTLRTRNSAAYKGLYAQLMHSCLDWQYNKTLDFAEFFTEAIDIHHIFPKDWCSKEPHVIDDARRESIVNKTALSASTNRAIGPRAPSVYLKTVGDAKHAAIPAERVDERVRTHKIDPSLLRADDFDGFFAERSQKLLDLVSAAMGKPILVEAATVDAADQFDVEEAEATVDLPEEAP